MEAVAGTLKVCAHLKRQWLRCTVARCPIRCQGQMAQNCCISWLARAWKTSQAFYLVGRKHTWRGERSSLGHHARQRWNRPQSDPAGPARSGPNLRNTCARLCAEQTLLTRTRLLQGDRHTSLC